MAGKIFINYRRGDDPGSVQALFAHLEQTFSPEQLFMDVDSIEPGLDFMAVLKEQVMQCDVLISVIGKGWLDARDDAGQLRLANPDDFVRIEIEYALQQNKRVIPVLVGQAQMPRADKLPEPMRPLARRHAVRLTHERFRADVQALITALQRALKSADDARADQAHQAAAAGRAVRAQEKRSKGSSISNKTKAAQKGDAERLLIVLRGLAPFIKPSSDPAWSCAPALRVIDCVLALNRPYDSFVVKRLNKFECDHPAVRTISDLYQMLTSCVSPHQFMLDNLSYNDEERASTLDAVVKWLVTISGRDSEQQQLLNLESWAKSSQPQEYSRISIRGFGLAGFQYLRMLFGANTTKPDIYICRFVESNVGHRVSPIQALRLLESAASSVGISLRDLDSTINSTRLKH
jgi:hypothetical protein